MARIRSIKPGFCTSEAIASLSLGCELHFAKLWTYADDEGRGIDNARLIKGAIWPLRDEVDVAQVEEWQAELAQCGRLERYEVGGKRYFQVANWPEHQKPQHPKPSECPPPPLNPSSDAVQNGNGHLPAPESPHEAYGGLHEDSPEKPPVVVVGEVVGEGEGGGEEPSPPPMNRSTALALVGAGVSTPSTDGFEDFWQTYPKRNGKRLGRSPTEAKWKRLSSADRRAACVGAANLARAVEQGLTLPKDPERFLRHRVWEDWQEPAEPEPVRVNGRTSTVERSWRNILEGPTEGIK